MQYCMAIAKKCEQSMNMLNCVVNHPKFVLLCIVNYFILIDGNAISLT